MNFINFVKTLTKKNMKKLLFLIAFSLLLASCMTTKTSVGTYDDQVGKVETYAKGKQFWVFAGLIPIGRTNVKTPNDGNCQVVVRYTFGDVLLTSLTAGVISSKTIKVNVKK